MFEDLLLYCYFIVSTLVRSFEFIIDYAVQFFSDFSVFILVQILLFMSDQTAWFMMTQESLSLNPLDVFIEFDIWMSLVSESLFTGINLFLFYFCFIRSAILLLWWYPVCLSLFIILLSLFCLSLPKFRIIFLGFSFFLLFLTIFFFFYLRDSFFLWGFFVYLYRFSFLNFSLTFTFNFISLFLIFLTFILSIICCLVVWNVRFKARLLFLVLFFIWVLLIFAFLVDDVLIFYVCFEILAIPMFLLIGIWGARERRIKAAYQFFLYTIFGSFFLLVSIFFIYSGCGTTDVNVYSLCYFSENRQIFCWFFFFIGVSLKVPMMPLHLWLPEAHVEAPTVGSIILAGILLKLGVFALLKFAYPVFYVGNTICVIFVGVFSGLSVLYASFATILQSDMKKLVAYSSIAHMNFCVLGLFTGTFIGWAGGFLIMLAHGFVSTALFLCVGVLYDRYKTRSFLYYGGLQRLMPLFSVFSFLLNLANMGFPGTFNFVSEILVLFGIVGLDLLIGFLVGVSTVFSAVYSLSLYTNLFLLDVKGSIISFYADITKREFFLLFFSVVFVIFFGLFPNFILFPLENNFAVYADSTRLIFLS